MYVDVRRSPRIELHEGTMVVRDDQTPGGTKARLFLTAMRTRPENEFVYAGPAVGLAQVALAVAAYQTCKEATLFVARRTRLTNRTKEALDYGARLVEVSPGYLSVVQSRARSYCWERGAYLMPFGGGQQYGGAIVEVARSLGVVPETVWCAAGSGTLAHALHTAWPTAVINAVAVGRAVEPSGNIRVISAPYRYNQPANTVPPFSADRFYEAKAWEAMQMAGDGRDTLFWNVAGHV